jgi:hypothetical protein
MKAFKKSTWRGMTLTLVDLLDIQRKKMGDQELEA